MSTSSVIPEEAPVNTSIEDHRKLADMSGKNWFTMAEKVNHWPKGFHITKAEAGEADLYTKYKVSEYHTTNLEDEDLWEVFRIDFAGWSAKNFHDLNQHICTSLRTELRHRGVWVNMDKKKLMSESLMATLTEKEPVQWNFEEIQGLGPKIFKFNSHVVTNLARTGTNAVNFGTHTPFGSELKREGTSNATVSIAPGGRHNDVYALQRVYGNDKD